MNFESQILEVQKLIQRKAKELHKRDQLTLQESDFLNFLIGLDIQIDEAFQTIM